MSDEPKAVEAVVVETVEPPPIDLWIALRWHSDWRSWCVGFEGTEAQVRKHIARRDGCWKLVQVVEPKPACRACMGKGYRLSRNQPCGCIECSCPFPYACGGQCGAQVCRKPPSECAFHRGVLPVIEACNECLATGCFNQAREDMLAAADLEIGDDVKPKPACGTDEASEPDCATRLSQPYKRVQCLTCGFRWCLNSEPEMACLCGSQAKPGGMTTLGQFRDIPPNAPQSAIDALRTACEDFGEDEGDGTDEEATP